MKVRLLTKHLCCLFGLATIAALGCQHAKRSALEPCCDSKVAMSADWLHDSPCTSARLLPIPIDPEDLAPPRTIQNPEAGTVWELHLYEAIGVALRNSDVIRTLAGNSVIVDPTSTIYDPAIAETIIQNALSEFDANWTTSAFWTRIDQPPGITFGGGIPVPNERDQAEFHSSLTKKIATGGIAGIAFNSNYLFIPPFRSTTLSPGPDGIFGTPDDVIAVGQRRTPAQYTPNVEFTLSQPLLKGAGTDFNRAPIVIARLESDRSLWDLKQSVLSQVRSVEEAYWNLFAAHGVLRALEDALPLLQELVRIRDEELKVEKVTGDLLAEAQSRYSQFQQQRVLALAAVLETEAVLRNLMGLSPSDGRRLVPVDPAKDVPILFDWESTLRTAVEFRPNIVKQRLLVRIRELQLLRARNGLQPQLDVQGLWRINGLDKELDEAIGVMNDNQFTDWQLGFTLSVPLGYRQASAQVQASELQLDKDRALLRQTVFSTVHQLGENIRDIDSLISQYQITQERYRNSLVWVEIARNKALPELAIGDLAEKQNLYIQAIQEFRDASVEIRRLLSLYNTALARLEETKGTLLSVSNIQLLEDPVARVRFSESRLPSVPAPNPASPDNI
jgi:outer membrane protein TolC